MEFFLQYLYYHLKMYIFFFFFQLVIKPNVIKKANGSAYYEAENIKIICGV